VAARLQRADLNDLLESFFNPPQESQGAQGRAAAGDSAYWGFMLS